MAQALIVRRLGPGDVGAMRRLNALFAKVFGDPDAYASNPPSDEYLADALATHCVIALGAFAGDEIAGGLVAYEFDKLEQARREIYIYDLAVREAHRRQGVATALIGRVKEIARDRSAWAVYVQADYGDDPAVALYTKLGRREDVMHFDIDPAPG
jgi:aminoglycoside 3-N-acetyltransferase I